MALTKETLTIQSKLFGPFEVDEQTVMKFTEGIPGLESVKEYAMVTFEEYAPIVWMISTDGIYHFPLVLYRTIDFNDFDRESQQFYKIQLDKYLGRNEHKNAYVILKLDNSVQTVSLRSPIIVDPVNRIGKQLILEAVSQGSGEF
jgi:flagellar assembly factor FliW